MSAQLACPLCSAEQKSAYMLCQTVGKISFLEAVELIAPCFFSASSGAQELQQNGLYALVIGSVSSDTFAPAHWQESNHRSCPPSEERIIQGYKHLENHKASLEVCLPQSKLFSLSLLVYILFLLSLNYFFISFLDSWDSMIIHFWSTVPA